MDSRLTGKDNLDIDNISREEIALELALKFMERTLLMNNDHSPKGEGKAIAELYNSIYENLIKK